MLCMWKICVPPNQASKTVSFAKVSHGTSRNRLVGNADNLYEEVEPVAVTDARLSESGREFLVKFPDAEEDSWVSFSL